MSKLSLVLETGFCYVEKESKIVEKRNVSHAKILHCNLNILVELADLHCWETDGDARQPNKHLPASPMKHLTCIILDGSTKLPLISKCGGDPSHRSYSHHAIHSSSTNQ